MSIEIITSKDFDDSDLESIKHLFDEAGFEINIDNESMIMKSEEIHSAIWIFVNIFAWAAKPFFTGFFNKMGEDAYDNFKETIKKIARKQKRGHDIQLRIHVRKDEDMIIAALPSDRDELKIALDALPGFLDANPDLNEWIVFENGKWKKTND